MSYKLLIVSHYQMPRYNLYIGDAAALDGGTRIRDTEEGSPRVRVYWSMVRSQEKRIENLRRFLSLPLGGTTDWRGSPSSQRVQVSPELLA